MAQTFRTDDFARWGAGQGFNLTPAQVDINFWDIIQRLVTLEALPDPSAGIDHFSITGINLYVHMTDASVLGPYELPVTTFRDRGDWAPETNYSVMDTFGENGGLYVVLLDHESDLTFDAGANDGLGNNYYQLMLQPPGTALPTGGATGMVLEKSTDDDFETTWGYKLPEDGNTREYLIKQSNANQDAEWETPQAADIEFTPVTSSLITSTTVDEALEELSSGTAIDATGIPFTPPTGSSLTSDNVHDAIVEVSSGGSAVGRQTIWIPATAMTPLGTDGAAIGSVELSNGTMLKSLDFDSTNDEYAQFEIAMPKSWDGSEIFFKVFWSHPATTVNFDVWWEIGTNTVTDAGNLDVTPSGGSYGGVADTGGVTNYLFVSDESEALDLTGAGYGDLIIFRVDRYPAATEDTLAVDARLHGIQLIYTTNAATDD